MENHPPQVNVVCHAPAPVIPVDVGVGGLRLGVYGKNAVTVLQIIAEQHEVGHLESNPVQVNISPEDFCAE